MFDGSKSEFRYSLEEGDGVFWTSGKAAGSGKSATKKFLSDNRRTRDALQPWVGFNKFVIAAHFFWNNGSDMQKSQQGLLQTLLRKVLKKLPDMIAKVLPLRWTSSTSAGRKFSWQEEQLLDASS